MPVCRSTWIWNSVTERGFDVTRMWELSPVTRPPIAALEELDRYSGRIPLSDLQSWLTRADLTLEHVRPFLRFDPGHYVRNLMYAGPGYQALVLCWRSGQRSPIHDHTGSSCAVKVIQGVATETVFARGPNGMLYAVGSRQLPAGCTCASQDSDVHQMSNLQSEGEELITLHIYSPPLLYMNMYSIIEPRVTRFFDPINDEFVSGAGI
jgi:cysteine dioxygenase